jgi:hypothetical protein
VDGPHNNHPLLVPVVGRPHHVLVSRYKIQNSKFKIQNSKFKIQNSKLDIKVKSEKLKITLFPGLASHLKSNYLPIHIFFGLMIFICACATALLGILEKTIFTLGFVEFRIMVFQNASKKLEDFETHFRIIY